MSNLWGMLWRMENALDGKREWIMNSGDGFPRLFLTRKAAQADIESLYGYIRTRKDLRSEPHGWKMPIPVKVEVKRV